jgi:hypothetical protein
LVGLKSKILGWGRLSDRRKPDTSESTRRPPLARNVRKLRPDGRGASCRTIVVAEKPAEALTATNRTEGTRILRGVDEVVAEALVVPFTVIVRDEFGKGTTEVPLSERNEAVEAFLFDGTDEPLRVCAAVR